MRKLRNIILSLLAVGTIIGITNVDAKTFKEVAILINKTIQNEQASNLTGNEVIVMRVVDGDTIIIKGSDGVEERVRLLLIDTPESVHPSKPVEPFGKEASDFAEQYINNGKKFVLERGNPERDRYGRSLAYLWIDGINFNEIMIAEGFARVAYVIEPNVKYLNDFKKAELNAKKAKKGIWSIPNYVTERGFNPAAIN